MDLDVFIDSRHSQSFGAVTVPVHKHRWQVRIIVEEPGEDHAVVRYSKVLSAVTVALQRYDGVILNDVFPFNIIEPTHGNVAMYFFNSLEDTLAIMDLKLVEISLWEDQDLVKQVKRRSHKLDEALRGEDILTNMRQGLPEQVVTKRTPIKKRLAKMITTATRSF